MIWIRTQNGQSLVECCNLHISNGGIGIDYKIIANCKLMPGNEEDYEVLGYYEKKSTAIEVLNSINIYINDIIFGTSHGVYKMPKDYK